MTPILTKKKLKKREQKTIKLVNEIRTSNVR